MKYDNERIGENLKYLIKEYGMKQIDLAKRLGVTQQTVTAWVKGERAIREKNLVGISNFFNIDFDSLVGDDLTKPLEDRLTNERLKNIKATAALIRYYEALGFTFEYLNMVTKQDGKTIIDRPKGIRITWIEEDCTITKTISSSEFSSFIRNMHNRAELEIKQIY